MNKFHWHCPLIIHNASSSCESSGKDAKGPKGLDRVNGFQQSSNCDDEQKNIIDNNNITTTVKGLFP